MSEGQERDDNVTEGRLVRVDDADPALGCVDRVGEHRIERGVVGVRVCPGHRLERVAVDAHVEPEGAGPGEVRCLIVLVGRD